MSDSHPGKRKADEPVVSPSSSQSPSQQSKKAKPAPTEVEPEASNEDLEWARFQAEMLADETDGSKTPAEGDEVERREAQHTKTAKKSASSEAASGSNYADATIEVQPQLTRGRQNAEDDGEDEGGEADEEETEERRRARLLREEKEEILARLDEEQRLQDEAEERVAALKARMEKIKAAKAARAKKTEADTGK